nr:hypothetical protein [Streptomyces sp. ISL-86]
MDQVVPGDVVKLAAGDLIPADLRIVSSKDLMAGQAALSGGSLPVAADPLHAGHGPRRVRRQRAHQGRLGRGLPLRHRGRGRPDPASRWEPNPGIRRGRTGVCTLHAHLVFTPKVRRGPFTDEILRRC